VRSDILKLYLDFGRVTTTPTQKGERELDVMSPDFEVKRINSERVVNFTKNDTRFIRIEEQVRLGNIARSISFVGDNESPLEKLKEKWTAWWVGYGPNYEVGGWDKLRAKALDYFFQQEVPKFQSEVVDHLYELAQQQVTEECQASYRKLLMSGPFSSGKAVKSYERERLPVMGLVLEKLDRFNGVVTLAVVDAWGELQAIRKLTSLLLY